MQERLYTGTAVVVSSRESGGGGRYSSLTEGTSIISLALSFASRVASESIRR
jgi:hypothetical protein